MISEIKLDGHVMYEVAGERHRIESSAANGKGGVTTM
jgi:hypothetical protein